jgi:O-antigen ligase
MQLYRATQYAIPACRQAGARCNTNMSFITFLLYLIATFIRPQEWMPFFYGKPLILILSIATLVFLIFERISKKEERLIKVPQNFLILGLFFAVIMSHVAHTYFAGMVDSIKIFYVNVVLYFIILNVLNTERKFKIAVWLIAILIILAAFQGIYQFNHGYGWAGQAMHKEGDILRINWVGIFNDPNDLALTFVIAVGILLPFALGKTKIIPRIFSIIFLGLLNYGIFLTNSRGGFLALLVTVFFYFVARTRKFILGGILGALAVIAVLGFGPSRMALLSIQEESAYNRVDIWYQGLLLMKSNPLFGVGFNMFQDGLPMTAHNSYVLAGAELGFLGLFFWIGLLYVAFKQFALVQKYQTGLKKYALGLQAGLIGFCAAAFFLSRTYIILPYLLFALGGSIFYLTKQKNSELSYNFTFKETRTVFFLCVGVLMTIFTIIKIGL